MNQYRDLERTLNSSSIYPSKTIIVKKEGEVVDGLWLWVNPFFVTKMMIRLRDIVGDEYSITNFPSLQEIHIKLKQ